MTYTIFSNRDHFQIANRMQQRQQLGNGGNIAIFHGDPNARHQTIARRIIIVEQVVVLLLRHGNGLFAQNGQMFPMSPASNRVGVQVIRTRNDEQVNGMCHVQELVFVLQQDWQMFVVSTFFFLVDFMKLLKNVETFLQRRLVWIAQIDDATLRISRNVRNVFLALCFCLKENGVRLCGHGVVCYTCLQVTYHHSAAENGATNASSLCRAVIITTRRPKNSQRIII
jgi:hypothetical protein